MATPKIIFEARGRRGSVELLPDGSLEIAHPDGAIRSSVRAVFEAVRRVRVAGETPKESPFARVRMIDESGIESGAAFVRRAFALPEIGAEVDWPASRL